MQKNNIKEAQSHIFCQDKNIFEHITVDEEQLIIERLHNLMRFFMFFK